MIGNEMNTYDSFYYHHHGFPGNLNLIPVPKGDIPKFIKTKHRISPFALYEKHLNEDMRGLLCIRFLAVFYKFYIFCIF